MEKMTLKKCFLAAFILLPGMYSFAQKKYEMKVKDAVEMALTNLTDIKNAEIDVEIQLAQNREITGQALPQITANAGINKYLELPLILFPDASST